MKKWFSEHSTAIVAFLIFIATYIIASVICTEYVNFGYNYRDKNIDVAKFYFLQLPLWSCVPSVLYLLITIISKIVFRKIKSNENTLSDCLVRSPYIANPQASMFYALRESCFDNYWSVISTHIDDALGYMFAHPNEFFVGEKATDDPGWDENSYFSEIIYVNGKKLIVFLHYKSFMVDLNNCVKAITNKK